MKHHTCTRLLSLVLAVVMALSLLSVAAFAADVPAYAHLEIGTASGQPGETVKIPIYMKGIKEGQKCRGFDTTVELGENLTLEGAEWTDLVSGFGYKICNKDSGYLNAVDMMNSGFRITENGKLCDLLVKIADDATSVGAVSLTNVSISGEQATDFLNSTDGKMSGRDLSAVVTPTDENGASVPIISIKQTASFTMNVTADKTSVTAGEDVTVTVKVEGGDFVGAAAKLAYDSSEFTIKAADTGTGWSKTSNGYAYYNVAADQSATLGTFVFTALAQAEEVTGSFTLSDTYCEETWDSGASADVATPCANNGKVDVTIALKDDLEVTAENKAVTYDGNAHAFDEVTTTAAGATIAYGETEGTYDLTDVPADKVDAGTYTLYYKVTAPGYTPKTGSYTLTINPASIEYTATGFDGTYDGANHTITVTVTNPANAVITYSEEENGTYTGTAPVYSQANTNATVWFKITAGDNYTEVKSSRTVKISEADMTVDITAKARVTYDGQPHVSATINKLIPSGAIISYMWGETQVGTAGDNTPPSFTDAGEYEIWWTAMRSGYKTTTGSYTFNIDKADIDSSKYSITANSEVNYDGAAHASATASIPEGMTVTYTYGGQTYNEIPSFKEIGTYTVNYTVSAGKNYNDATGFYTFAIKDGTIEASSTGYHGIYDGNPHSITVTVTKPDDTTTYYRTSEDAAWSDKNPTFTTAGTYTVYWQVEKNSYKPASGSDTVQIDKANITDYSVTANEAVKYDGQPHVSATVSLPKGATITYTYGDSETSNEIPSFTDVGEHKVSYTITAGTNYNDVTGSYTFTIEEGILTGIVGSGYTGEYDGQAHTITVKAPSGATVTYSETENGEYTTTAPTLTNVGSKTVYWKVTKPGYATEAASNKITITQKSVTIVIDKKEKFIGDADPEFTAAVEGLVASDDLGTITLEREAGETAGEYEISANYTANANYDVTVTKAKLTIMTPLYVVETVRDYVPGYSLVLVYTDGNATFTYGGKAMYGVTSAGYEHPEHVGTKYAHVYALVVSGAADEGKVAVGTTPVADTLKCDDLDVNKSGSVDLRDAVAVVAVYNTNETYMTRYMSIVLEADVNHDKRVDSNDFGKIIAEYLK